jgi:outer membrane protein OmpA-like peptidoglycan-associated protein
MEIINSLKSRIGEAEEEKICQFLGESIESVDKSFDLILNAMLGGLKEIAQRNGDASAVLKVINDGGHSGDLTDNLLGLFGNSNKMKLLITIGKNINSHFFGNNIVKVINKITSLGGISKTSAVSLFSLAAPLVLGVMGKNIKIENLDKDQFSLRLQNEKMTLDPEVSSSLLSALGFSEKGVQHPVKNKVEEREVNQEFRQVYKKRKKPSGDKLTWIAWVLLALLGLAVAYYTLKEKYLIPKVKQEVVMSISDSSDLNSVDDSIFEELDMERNENNSKEEASLNQKAPVDSENLEGKNKVISLETPLNTPVTREMPASIDTRSMAVKLRSSKSFFAINNLSFKMNSAEVSNSGEVAELINFLNDNPGKSIEIAGTGSSTLIAEDRAYGLQGLLFESGIDNSRLKVLSYALERSDGSVVVKIK